MPFTASLPPPSAGVVNGIDNAEWCPDTDAFLTSDGYSQYGLHNNFEGGKAACKAALQKVRRAGGGGGIVAVVWL